MEEGSEGTPGTVWGPLPWTRGSMATPRADVQPQPRGPCGTGLRGPARSGQRPGWFTGGSAPGGLAAPGLCGCRGVCSCSWGGEGPAGGGISMRAGSVCLRQCVFGAVCVGGAVYVCSVFGAVCVYSVCAVWGSVCEAVCLGQCVCAVCLGQCVCVCVCVYACSVAQSCPTLCDPLDCSPPGSSVHGIFQIGRASCRERV